MDSIETLVILGATGDLTKRLLLPALGEALTRDEDRRVKLIGSSYRKDDEWTDLVRESFATVGSSGSAVDAALETTEFRVADATSADDLRALLAGIEYPATLYFALSPSIWERTVELLADLDIPGELHLVAEKPFGTDLESARALNRGITDVVPEEQIVRIDHFLGVTGTQSLLGLRFANPVLEPLWNRDHLESLEIVWEESLGLEGRAGFYDATGATRDMIQSHLLQVTAMALMEAPGRLDADAVGDAVIDLLRSLRIHGDPATSIVRGQYTAGSAGGIDLPAYAAEDGVDPARETETFVQVTLESDTDRWRGVPIVLRTAKAVGEPRSHIRATFRPVADPVAGVDETQDPTVLTIGFEDGSVALGLTGSTEADTRGPVRMSLTDAAPIANVADLLDTHPGLTGYLAVARWVLAGDATFSVRGDAAEECWRITEDILAGYASSPLRTYAAGSRGPSA